MAKKTENTENVQTLSQLMNVKKQLQLQALENLGEMDEAMIKVWESTEVAIPVKLDGYGFIIDKLESEKDFLDAEIKQAREAKQSIDNAVKAMKHRLSYFANGDKLEGIKYSFSPFDSVKSEVQMFLLPKEAGKYELPEVTYAHLQFILEALKLLSTVKTDAGEINDIAKLYDLLKDARQKCGVKEAPEDCVLKIIEPSVRIGRKSVKQKQETKEDEN